MVYLKENWSTSRGTLRQNARDDLRKNVFERGFFTLFQDPASYEDPDLWPTNATIEESVQMCCPFQGFPPPQVSWELPNGTLIETGSTILHVTVKTENDFGRYRCIARSLEKNVLTTNITIRKRSKYNVHHLLSREKWILQEKPSWDLSTTGISQIEAS